MPNDEQRADTSLPPAERPRYRQLDRWERTGAIAAAVVVGTVGFIAMFKTSNEGGVAVAVLLAGVLLVIGIQGTQIGKLGGKDIGAEMALREEERREIAQISKTVAEESPAEAQAMLEGYQVADPGARYAPEVVRASSYVFQQQVFGVLPALFPDAKVVRQRSNGVDLLDGRLIFENDERIGLYFKRPDSIMTLTGRAAAKSPAELEALLQQGRDKSPAEGLAELAVNEGLEGVLVISNGRRLLSNSQVYGVEIESISLKGDFSQEAMKALRDGVHRLRARVRGDVAIVPTPTA
ncbi:hypothetical protein [Dactylosporangium sp. CA-139066]|uniref:hypothetical protein n=1 Tax=Dactylosporangium sp. CA-139066 TaxID=3239930 RepID=UPI003D8BFCAE